jgi:predicted phage terminase large subunit-like protein
LRTDKVHIVDELPEGLRFARAWDLASSKKERVKDDPDYTVGVKGAVKMQGTAVKGLEIATIYIEDVIRGQWEGMKRNEIIINTTIADGDIPVGIEAFGPYKDAYTEIRDILSGIRAVRKAQLPGDKVAKADPLVPIFEAGNVYLKRGPWNHAFLKVLSDFPSGKHDDDPDALAVLYHMLVKRRLQLFTSKSLAENEQEEQGGAEA